MISIKKTCRGCSHMQLKSKKYDGHARLHHYCWFSDKWLESIDLLEDKRKSCDGFKGIKNV